MSQSYENLTGGTGRGINYRAERYDPRTLLRHVYSELEVDGKPVLMSNMSATGLCYLADDCPQAATPGSVVDFRLRLGGRDAATGRARVVRIERSENPIRIALHFLDRLVAPERIRALGAGAEFAEALDRGVERYAAAPSEYRDACDEVHVFMAHWQRLLDERERQIRRQGDDVADLLRETGTAAIVRMREEWAGIRRRIAGASDSIDAGSPAHAAACALTNLQLDPHLERSPILSRARTKPLGYPGDYRLMVLFYRQELQANDLFGRALDQLFLDERLANTVPARRDALVDALRRATRERSTKGRPLRFLNIGSGPAQEMFDWISELPPGPDVELVLVDQDAEALGFAQQRLAGAALRHGGRVRVVGRHLSFKQLFARPEQLAEVSGCDLVYSAGLFDYLRDETAALLMMQCFDLLDEGGRLLVGNAVQAPMVRWMPEFMLDWRMIYRTREDMRRLGQPFADRARLELGADASGAWHLLSIEREH
jgi:extracellular factor (EF) 3-hydroxypalmitic acid methyl ester biosynthesis protein